MKKTHYESLSLASKYLLLFLFFDHADVLAELDQLLVVLERRHLFLLLVQKQVDFVTHAHSFVLRVVVLAVRHRVLRLSLDQSLNVFIFLFS